jgi:hypothetical protein
VIEPELLYKNGHDNRCMKLLYFDRRVVILFGEKKEEKRPIY